MLTRVLVRQISFERSDTTASRAWAAAQAFVVVVHDCFRQAIIKTPLLNDNTFCYVVFKEVMLSELGIGDMATRAEGEQIYGGLEGTRASSPPLGMLTNIYMFVIRRLTFCEQ